MTLDSEKTITSKLFGSPKAAARRAGLHYSSDEQIGITRLKKGKGFTYLTPAGGVIGDRTEIKRIRALVIPPAWQNVWINSDPTGHLQATGLDDKGRKQYRYHPDWNKIRNETKYYHIVEFAEQLPKIRRRVMVDLDSRGITKEKVVATAIRILDSTAIRVGNEQYAKDNESFGLTTMRDRHVTIKGANVEFEFKGKSGVYQKIDLNDKKVAKIIRQCQELPGFEVFQYKAESGDKHTLDSQDINDYLTEIAGKEFTAKDFRTWSGTVEASVALYKIGQADTAVRLKQNITEAITQAADVLGNLPATCRKFYIHPAVILAYQDNSLDTYFKNITVAHHMRGKSGLTSVEEAVLEIIKDSAKKSGPSLEKEDPK